MTRETVITDLAHDGRGMARIDGQVALIDGALPGERVRYRLTRRAKQVDEGRMTELLEASPQRTEPGCPHFALCGGCALQHLDPGAQLAFKQKQLLDALWRIGRVRPETVAEPIAGPVWGYRRRARLGVKWLDKRGVAAVGFREVGSERLAALQVCPVLDERVSALLPALTDLIGTLSIRARLPQIELAAAEHVALVLRVLQPPSEADHAALIAFADRHGVELLLQPGGPDSIVPLRGEQRPLSFSPDGSDDRLEFRPTDFIQVNGEISQAIVRRALDWIDARPGEAVLDLFCGLGNFTVPLARRGATVTGVEGDEALVRRARNNAERLGLSIDYQRADLFAPDPRDRWARSRSHAVLLDPPRAGAREVLPTIAALRPSRIVYVSCHPGTLARDAGRLVTEFGYRLKSAGVMDMFPHTAHIESMAHFVIA